MTPHMDIATPSARTAPTAAPRRFSLQFPLHYTARCKRKDQAGNAFLLDNLDDLIVMLLAFALFSPAPFLAAPAVICLHLSFWAIYEAGYFQNDLVALKHEVDPKVPPAFHEYRHVYSEPVAWLWAGLFALGGAALAAAAVGPFLGISAHTGAAATTGIPPVAVMPVVLAAAVWMGLLGLMRATFHLYNHVDKMSRVYLYLPLQVMKYGLPAIFFVLSPVGAALLVAQVMRRWLPYLQYRLTGMKKDIFPARIVRLMTFAVLFVLLLPANAGIAYFGQGVVIFAFLMLRAWRYGLSRIRAARWITDDTWRGVPAPAPMPEALREPVQAARPVRLAAMQAHNRRQGAQ